MIGGIFLSIKNPIINGKNNRIVDAIPIIIPTLVVRIKEVND